jgi:hypothetical protein
LAQVRAQGIFDWHMVGLNMNYHQNNASALMTAVSPERPGAPDR